MFAIGTALLEKALDSHRGGVVTSRLIHHLRLGEVTANAFEQGDGLAGEAVVVAPLHHTIAGIGADNGHLHLLVQGEQVGLVLQQDEAFLSHLQSQCLVFLAIDYAIRNITPGHILVHLTQFKACSQQAFKRTVDGSFVYQTVFYGLHQ